MAAVAYPLPDRVGSRGPARPPASPPSGRQIGGQTRRGPSPRPSAAVRRRRRLVAVVLAGGLLILLRPVVLPGGDPLVVPGQAAAGASTRPHMYTVRPGDTLWSIARQVSPQGDPRPLVDQLAAQVHGATLQAGERLVLP